MTDEEYERLKQQEKEHLRKMKALRKQARHLQRARETEQAAGGPALAQALLDESNALARKLDRESALGEARLEHALESTDGEDALPDEEDRQQRARDLVRRLRDEINAEGDAGGSNAPSGNAAEDDRPDKTIGPAT